MRSVHRFGRMILGALLVQGARAQSLPSIDNDAGALNVSIGVASLRGTLASDGGGATTVFTYWGAADGGTSPAAWSHVITNGILSAGAFSASISGIYYGVTYYYRCSAVNAAGTAWSPASSSFLSRFSFVMSGPGLGWATNAWTGDSTSGVSSESVPTCAVGFNGPGATINGVSFASHNGSATSGTGWSLGGAVGAYANDANNLTSGGGGSATLAKNFIYNGFPRTFSVTGLIPGIRYQTTFFSVGWENPGARFQTFSAGGASAVIDQDRYGNNAGIAMSYCFDASATAMNYTITPASGNSFHCYGLYNRAVGRPVTPITNRTATAVLANSATLNANLNCTGAVYEVEACWGPSDGGSDAGGWDQSESLGLYTNLTDAAIACQVSGLLSSRTYYFTFRMSNAGTNFWAPNVLSFTTLAGAPVIETTRTTAVLAGSASLTANLTTTGTSATAVTAYWGASDGGTSPSAWDHAATLAPPQNEGPLTAPAAGLAADSSYHYRFAASNATGVVWSPEGATFITGAIAVTATDAAEEGRVSGVFSISRPASCAAVPLTVAYSIGGTAQAGVHYAADLGSSVTLGAGQTNVSVTVTPINVWETQADTTVVLTVLPGPYVVGTSSSDAMTISNLPTPTLPGAVVYVDQTATGANSGSSWADAFTTIQAAVDSPDFTSTSDATILVAEGVYGETVMLAADNSGVSGAPNRIMAAPGDTVVVNGAATRANGIAATSLAWFVFDGLTVERATAEGVKLTSASSCTFTNCTISRNNHGIYLATSASNMRYAGCVIDRNTTAGIHYAAAGNGDSAADCTFRENGRGIRLLTPSRTSRFVAERCVFDRSSVYAADLAQPSYLYLDRCVLAGNNSGAYMSHGTDLVVTNSIVAYTGYGTIDGGSTANARFRNVLIHPSRFVAIGNPPAYSLGNMWYGAPSFVDPLHGDFRLYADSDALNRASDGTHLGLHPATTVALPTGTDYYVRPDGNDAASGMNDSADPVSGAFATLQRAADAATAPGDVVRIGAGNYAGTATIAAAGSSTRPIRFTAAGSVNLDATTAGITLAGAAHVAVEGVSVNTATSCGLATDWAYSCVISNCSATACSVDGLRLLNGRGMTVSGGTFSQNARHGITLENASDSRIDNLTAAQNGTYGVWMNENASSRRSWLERLVLLRNGSHGSYFRNSPGVVFNHCDLVANKGSGLFWGPNSSPTVVSNSLSAYNVLYGIDANFDANMGQLWHSLVWGNGAGITAKMVLGANIVQSAPGFVDLANDDLRFFDDSPALGAASDGANFGAVHDAGITLGTPQPFHVAPGGSDANDGLSPATAFATLTRASAACGPGDTVNVAAGAYTGPWTWTADGSPTAPIRILATGAGLKGGASGETLVISAAHVALTGLAVSNTPSRAIVLRNAPESRLTDCRTDVSAGNGLRLEAAPLATVEGCRFQRATGHGVHLIYSPNSRFDHLVSNNNTGTGFYCDGRDGSGVNYGVTVRQALLYRNSQNGIYLGGDSNWLTVDNTVIYDNTGHGFTTKDWGAQSVTLRNSIVVENNYGLHRNAGSMTITVLNCDVFGNTVNYVGTITPVNTISADPQFRSPAAGNFQLSGNSPCVDAGMNQPWMTTALDMAGSARIANGTVDMGAYEVGTGSTLITLR